MKIKLDIALSSINKVLLIKNLELLEWQYIHTSYYKTLQIKNINTNIMAMKVIKMLKAIVDNLIEIPWTKNDSYSLLVGKIEDRIEHLDADFEIDKQQVDCILNAIHSTQPDDLIGWNVRAEYACLEDFNRASKLFKHPAHCFTEKNAVDFDNAQIIFAIDESAKNIFYQIECFLICLNISYYTCSRTDYDGWCTSRLYCGWKAPITQHQLIELVQKIQETNPEIYSDQAAASAQPWSFFSIPKVPFNFFNTSSSSQAIVSDIESQLDEVAENEKSQCILS